MPAAAVIPAPIAYIKVVAVKKLVVELSARSVWAFARTGQALLGDASLVARNPCYCEEIRVFKAGDRLNTLAWNNKIGLGSTCWFGGQSND